MISSGHIYLISNSLSHNKNKHEDSQSMHIANKSARTECLFEWMARFHLQYYKLKHVMLTVFSASASQLGL